MKLFVVRSLYLWLVIVLLLVLWHYIFYVNAAEGYHIARYFHYIPAILTTFLSKFGKIL